METSDDQAPSRRSALLTRQSILYAARDLFSSRGYDQVGMREIATVAGADAALIIRYFGSKDGLLREILTGNFVIDPALLAAPRSDLGRTLAHYTATKDIASSQFDPVLILLRSAAAAPAVDLLRETFDREFIEPLADWLGGTNARLRAGLIAAELFGLAFTRTVLRSQSLSAEGTEALVDRVGAALQALIDDRPPG